MTIRQLDWEAIVGQPIRIYRNLNNHRMSVQIKVKGKGWVVAGHVTEAIVSDVTFHVSEAGRQRVIRDRCKNVHAWGQGILLGAVDPSIQATIDLKYNPYTDETFVERHSQQAIVACKYLVVRENQVFVSPDAVSEVKPATPSITLKRYRRPPTFTRFSLPNFAGRTQYKLDSL